MGIGKTIVNPNGLVILEFDMEANLSQLNGGTAPPSKGAGKGRRGMKKGQTNSGSFRPGPDPRRGCGPSKVKREFQEAVRDLTEDALDVLRDCMQDPKQPMKERRAAAELTLAHAHGRPVDRRVTADMTNQVNPKGNDLSLLSDAQLASLIAHGTRTPALEHDGEAQEGEYELIEPEVLQEPLEANEYVQDQRLSEPSGSNDE